MSEQRREALYDVLVAAVLLDILYFPGVFRPRETLESRVII